MLPTRLIPRSTTTLSRAAIAASLLGCSALSLLAVAPSAQAAEASCPATTLVQPFTRWEDSGYYSLVPGGSFEPGEASWTLTGGAKVAAGSETFAVTGKLGEDSLKLPAGATARSPFICVEPSDRTFRFFLRSEGGSAGIEPVLVYRSGEGVLVDNIKKLLAPGSAWEVSPILHTGAAAASAVFGGSAELAVEFISTKGTARIDDVYLDPRMKR